MKKVAAIIAVITFSLTACHYGKEDAQKSLERNEEYKGINVEQGPSIDPAYIESNGTKTEETPATDSTATAATDSTEQKAAE